MKQIINEYLENLDTIFATASVDVDQNRGKGEYTKLDLYDINQVRDFYETIMRLEQWDDSFEGDFVFKRRLVKVNKYLDIITKEDHKDMLLPHVLRGLFLELEIFFVKRRFVDTCKVRRGNSSVEVLIPPRNPESLGLPGNDEVLWGTIRESGDSNYCVAISCRGNQDWLREWITRASAWEYVRIV